MVEGVGSSQMTHNSSTPDPIGTEGTLGTTVTSFTFFNLMASNFLVKLAIFSCRSSLSLR